MICQLEIELVIAKMSSDSKNSSSELKLKKLDGKHKALICYVVELTLHVLYIEGNS